MKGSLVLILTLITALAFFALPAIAETCDYTIAVVSFKPTCESFTIQLATQVNGSDFQVRYALTLTPLAGGDVIEISEVVKGVPYPGSGECLLSEWIIKRSWGEILCGSYLLHGGVWLYDPRGIFLDNDCLGENITLDCPCGPCGECRGKVTDLTLQYNGASAALIEVVQKKPNQTVFPSSLLQPGDVFTFSGVDKKGTLGTEINIFVDGVLNTKIHTSCSQPIGPGLISGAFGVIEGYSLEGGLLCPLEPVPEPECGCSGKVTELTLQYNGASAVLVEVVQKKPNQTVFPSSLLQPDDVFTFSGVDKKGTLGTEISIFVDGVLNTKIHTSCSQPIGPGLTSGAFEVIEGYSLKGGPLCRIDGVTKPVPTADAPEAAPAPATWGEVKSLAE